MRIKNFLRFVNENLEPHTIGDKKIDVKSRQGEPILYDGDEFTEDDWQPTGDKPRKPDTEVDTDFVDRGHKFLSDEDDEKSSWDEDDEPFISDTDDESELSDKDYIY